MGSKIWPKEISQIGPMPPQAARLLRILGGLTRQSEGRLGEPVKSRSSTWRASDPLLCNNSASTITTSTISTMGWLAASAFSPRPLHCFPHLPSPPCCPSIIRIFSPHLLDTCMNEEIDK